MRLGCEQSVFLPRVVEQEEDLTCVKSPAVWIYDTRGGKWKETLIGLNPGI